MAPVTNHAANNKTSSVSNRPRTRSWSVRMRNISLLLLCVVMGSLILVLQFPPGDDVEQLRVGDVAARNILAPRRITYPSEIETDAARDRAEADVAEIHDLPDAGIARDQIARTRQILDYLDSVRADNYASFQQKKELVAAVNDLVLTDQIISGLLTIDNDSWAVVKAETISALNQAMRAEIRSNQLAATRRRLPTLLNLDVSAEAATIAIAIVEDLIKPNTFVNEERTAQERKKARDSVQPVNSTIEQNESIVRAGDVVTPADIEALEALGLQQPVSKSLQLIGTVAILAFAGLLMVLYINRMQPKLLKQSQYLWLTFGILLVYIALIRFMVPNHTLLPYLIPVAALSITLSALIDPHFGVFVTMLVAIIIGFVADNSLELAVYSIAGGLVGIFSLGRTDRVNRLPWAGVYVALTNVVVILIFRIPESEFDSLGLLQLVATGAANGALSASLTFLIFFLVGSLSGITTSLQLTDLARPTQPLLRQLLLRAPGTYHHSLMVSNMAEQAAERIGANTSLTRVGAYYHDIGKMLRPYFFVENQMKGINVQDRLDPHTSAQIIISHVKDGLNLAKKYKLPRAVRDFIPEHQGTGTIKYFYHRALENADDPTEVDVNDFRYPGPKPQSKETAIVMLADGCEAAVRASNPGSAAEIEEVVNDIILDRVTGGELDQCDLTMRDLGQIRDAFVENLQGVFHPRIKYPESVQQQLPEIKPGALPAPESVIGLDSPAAVLVSENEPVGDS